MTEKNLITPAELAVELSVDESVINDIIRNCWPLWVFSPSDGLRADKVTIITYCASLMAA